MGISPVAAIPKVLTETGLTKEDIDIFEVHTLLDLPSTHQF
jgi:acetyl-CoA acyltransferase 1